MTKTNNELNVILYGVGAVGSRFLEMMLSEKPEGVKIKAVCDSSVAVVFSGNKNEKVYFESLSEIISAKKQKRSFENHFRSRSGKELDLVDKNQLIDLVNNKSNQKYVIVDSTNTEDMLDILYNASKNGAGIISVNKKPYANGNYEKVNYLLNKAINTKDVQLRGTVGANLGAPDTLIDILTSKNPSSIHITGCMSGTLGHICSALDKGAAFSEIVSDSIKQGYTESHPWDDLSGQDVLNKAIILGRMILSYKSKRSYDSISICHESFIEKPQMKTIHSWWDITDEEPSKSPKQYMKSENKQFEKLRGGSFVNKIKHLDKRFKDLTDLIGKSKVLRYVAELEYSEKDSVGIYVSLRSFDKESAMGKLNGTDNLFLYGIDDHKQKLYFPPGPGAGIQTTAESIYQPLLKLREIL